MFQAESGFNYKILKKNHKTCPGLFLNLEHNCFFHISFADFSQISDKIRPNPPPHTHNFFPWETFFLNLKIIN